MLDMGITAQYGILHASDKRTQIISIGYRSNAELPYTANKTSQVVLPVEQKKATRSCRSLFKHNTGEGGNIRIIGVLPNEPQLPLYLTSPRPRPHHQWTVVHHLHRPRASAIEMNPYPVYPSPYPTSNHRIFHDANSSDERYPAPALLSDKRSYAPFSLCTVA